MSLGRVFAIARANLVRLLRDRLGLFFILVLPMIIIFVTGLQFGGSFEPRAGMSGVAGEGFDAELAEALDESWEVTVFDTEAEVLDRVGDGRLELGVLLPPGYDERLAAAEAVEIGETELRVAELIRPKLVADGMFLVGIDIVGDKILEVNVFSPGNLKSCSELAGVDFSVPIIEAMERKAEIAQDYSHAFDNRHLAIL